MSDPQSEEIIVAPPFGAKGKAVVAAFVWLAAIFGTVITQGLLHGTALHYATVFVVVVAGIAGVSGVHAVPNGPQTKTVRKRKARRPSPTKR